MYLFICINNLYLFVFRNFGEPNSVYDFQNMNLADVKKQLQQLSAKHETLRKKINVRVMNMIDK